MYQANLSWNIFRQILESLEKYGMIEVMNPEKKGSRILYKITEKGDYFLKNFDADRSLLDVIATTSSLDPRARGDA
jgi:predicted transcriptional regulator